MFQTTA